MLLAAVLRSQDSAPFALAEADDSMLSRLRERAHTARAM
jgi:hypothetical protein